MASVYRPVGRTKYRIEFKDQHGRTTTVAGFRDKRVTQELARQLETDAQRLRVGLAPLHPDATAIYLLGMQARGLTWKEFRRRFEEEHCSGLRPRSREKYQTVFDVFEEECEPKNLRDIDEEVLSKFAARLRERPVKKHGQPTTQIGLAPWTIKNYLAAPHAALEWAAAQKLLLTLPEPPRVKVPKKKPQPILAEEFDKLLAAALWRVFLLCG